MSFLKQIRTELDEMNRLKMITQSQHVRALRYLTSHQDDFKPTTVGPISSSEAVDMLLENSSIEYHVPVENEVTV